MSEVCPECGGAGMVLTIDASGNRAVRVCDCELAARTGYRFAAARIPLRHRHCSLDSYETDFGGADPSLKFALHRARKFVEGYPVETEGRGLLLVGPHGVGKTHLAVGVITALMRERGAQVLFCDFGDLLKEIRHSYDRQTESTELALLRPIFDAEVLVLDELGAQKPTTWVLDTVSTIISSRYNNKRTTIVTTNYRDLPAGNGELTDAQRSARAETLGDRIGDRMQSRLAEMCVRIEMHGGDFRQTAGRARFG